MIDDSEIDDELERITRSPVFAGSARSTEFLTFCVQSIRDPSSHLKETTIAIELFGRSPDFDPKHDPIVRVYAARVRKRLSDYYAHQGSGSQIQIQIPKGTYIPQIVRKPQASDAVTLREPVLPADTSARQAPSHAESIEVAAPVLDLVSSITKPDAQPVSAPKALPSLITLPARTAHWVTVASLVAIVLLAAFLARWWLYPAAVESSEITQHIQDLRPVTVMAGAIYNPSWAPDGVHVAYARGETPASPTHIYVQSLAEGGPATQLTAGEMWDSRPVWSPDGLELAFERRVDDAHFEVLRYDLIHKTTASAGRFLSYWTLRGDAPALDWSPDGQFLLTTEQASSTSPIRLILVSTHSGERTVLTSPPAGSTGDIDAKFSPDGKRVAFRRGGLGDLYTVSVEGESVAPARQLTFDMRGVRGIAWTDKGNSIVYGTQRGTGVFQLWRIAAVGGIPQPLMSDGFHAVEPSVTANGQLLLTHQSLETELVEGIPGSNQKQRILFSSDKEMYSARYSPDGRFILFESAQSGYEELWLIEEGQTTPTRLTDFRGSAVIYFPTWAPDGSAIAFALRRNGATQLYRYVIASHRLEQLTHTTHRHTLPAYSPDGRYLYFCSNDDGKTSLWRIASDGHGLPEPLYTDLLGTYALSTDGKWIYFATRNSGFSVVRVHLENHAVEEIYHGRGTLSFLSAVTIARNSVYLIISPSTTDLSATVLQIDLKDRTAKAVARLSDLNPDDLSGVSIGRNGSRMVYVRAKRDERTLYVGRLASLAAVDTNKPENLRAMVSQKLGQWKTELFPDLRSEDKISAVR